MRSPLTGGGALAQARDPLSRLTRRGWVWRGSAVIDGIWCAKEPGWRRRLAPHLSAAERVLETDAAALVLFAKPQEADCDALGGLTPLKRIGGCLSSVPIAPPTDSGLAAWLDGRLVRMRGGAMSAEPIAAFAPADLADWLDLSGAELIRGSAPPVRPEAATRPKSMLAAGAALTDDTFAEAGLQRVRAAVSASPERGWSGWLARIRRGRRTAPSDAARAPARGRSGADPARPGCGVAVLAMCGLIGAAVAALLTFREARSADAAANVFLEAAAAVFFTLLWLAGVLTVGALIGGAVRWVTGAAARPGSPEGRSPAQPSAGPPPRRSGAPSPLWRWLGDLMRRLPPITGRAYDRYARRVEELERLFAEGRIDEALKKGLALDPRAEDPPDPHADDAALAPLGGPGVRKRLEISAQAPPRSQPLAALPPQSRQKLSALYEVEARRAADEGDPERAAFIYAELLGRPEAAVKAFADAEQYAVAAKLAQGRRLAPTFFIPLWHRAGDPERALRLAERYGAYEALLAALGLDDAAFAALVRRAWAERLAAAGAFAAALETSAPLAREAATRSGDQGDPQGRAAHSAADMAALRLEWMAAAAAEAEPDPEALARALMALPAGAGAQEDGAQEGVAREAGSQEGAAQEHGGDDPALAAARRMIGETSPRAPERRSRLALRLAEADLEPALAPAFAARRLPELADSLTRRLLVDEATAPQPNGRRAMAALAEAGGQLALAADIRGAPPRRTTPPPPAVRHVSLGPFRGASALVAGAPMRAGKSLLAFEDGRIETVDRAGRTLWREQVWRVVDLIAIDPGRYALLIRDEPGERRLSVLDIERRRHADIGPVAFSAWAAQAGPRGWLVAEGGGARCDVANLSAAALLEALDGPIGAIEPLWRTPITVDGAVAALLHAPGSGDALWLLERADGSVERWRVVADSLQVRFDQLHLGAPVWPAATADLHRFYAADAAGRPRRFTGRLAPPTPPASPHPPSGRRPSEAWPTPDWRQLHISPAPRACDSVYLAPVATSTKRSPSEAAAGPPAPAMAVTPSASAPLFHLAAPGAAALMAREAAFADHAVIRDDTGRYAVVSATDGSVWFANVSLEHDRA